MPNERAIDSKEDQRIQAILMQRIHGRRATPDAGASVRFSIGEDGQPKLDAPEGMTQETAEAVLVRAVFRYFLEN